MSLNWKHAALALTALGAAAAPGLASAGHVSVGVGINLGPPGYYAPAPVYAAPPPVYTYDPPPVIYAPPPAVYGYGPPVPVYRPYYRRPHCWWGTATASAGKGTYFAAGGTLVPFPPR